MNFYMFQEKYGIDIDITFYLYINIEIDRPFIFNEIQNILS